MHRQLEDSMVSVMAQPILQKPASQQRTVSHVTSPTTQAEKERPTQTSATGVSPATVQCKDKLTFKGASNSLSNWAPCDLVYKGKKFSSLEQAYFYILLKENREHMLAEDIMTLSEPSVIKEIGESVQVSDDWKKKNVYVMRELMEAKFQIPQFKKSLIETYPRELCHNVASNFWGTGPNGRGRNITGSLLMEIRENLIGKRDATSTPNFQSQWGGQKSSQASHLSQCQGGMKYGDVEVLLVGNSQVKEFRPDKVAGYSMVKEDAYTIQEASNKLTTEEKLPPTIILHLLTNEAKKEPVSKIAKDMKTLVKNLKQKHKSRVFVSLGVPVDDFQLHKKVRAVNLLLEADESIEAINHHNSFITYGYLNEYLYNDKIHPNEMGLRRLVANFKTALNKKI